MYNKVMVFSTISRSGFEHFSWLYLSGHMINRKELRQRIGLANILDVDRLKTFNKLSDERSRKKIYAKTKIALRKIDVAFCSFCGRRYSL